MAVITPCSTRSAAKSGVGSLSSTPPFALNSPKSPKMPASVFTGRFRSQNSLPPLPNLSRTLLGTTISTRSKPKTSKMRLWMSWLWHQLERNFLSMPPFAIRWPKGTLTVPFPNLAELRTLANSIRKPGIPLPRARPSYHAS